MNNFFWYSLFHIGSIFTLLLTLLLSSKILRSSRMPSVTMGWLLIIIFVPLLGIPLYLAFGDRKLGIQLNKKDKLKLHASQHHSNKVNSHPIHSLLISLGLPASSSDNQCNLHRDGKESWFALVDLLEKAEQSIDIAIFILGKDAVGQKIISILEQKAKQGVKIRLLLDGVGSFTFSKKRYQTFIKNGGELAWFIPVIHRPLRGRTNLRNHRKIVIVDRSQAWAGGRNFSQDYMGPECPKNCWVDMSFSQRGDIVVNYLDIFEADWAFATHTTPIVTRKINQQSPDVKGQNCELQLIPSGPDVLDDPIYAVILTTCYVAKSHIRIITPYYIPDDNVQKAIKLAALRGLEIDLILPEKSNHRLADIARNRFLRELADAGVKIWYFPEMIHAKVIVIDNDFAMAGSANLDIRSLFLNCELMSGFYSSKDILWLSHWVEELRKTCKLHQNKPVSAMTELIEGIVLLGAYQL